MTKKMTALLVQLLCMCIIMTGCGMKQQENDDKIKIVTTVFASYDFARQAAGDLADVMLLLKPGAESHSYEPSPKDIIEIEECDLFIYTGGESDTWIDYILDRIDNSGMKVIKMLDLVDRYEEEHVEGMEGHHHHEHDEDEETEWDEHVWTDPLNALKITEAVRDALIETDPDNEKTYRDNYDRFELEIKELDEDFRELTENAVRKEIVFGDRFPLRYFAEAYGLEYYAAFPGCAAQSEPSAATVAFLIDKVKEDHIPVIFKIELSSGNIADAIAADTGAKVLTFYSCHNISRDDFENGITYMDFMKKNLESLREALN